MKELTEREQRNLDLPWSEDWIKTLTKLNLPEHNNPGTPFTQTKLFWYWITERHNMYRLRKLGKQPPWTYDPILRDYKFTNPFRENDRVTVWMRNWTKLHDNRPLGEILFNCCLFRMIGTSEFAEEHGWVSDEFIPEHTKYIIEKRMAEGLRTFTGAYIITNQGIKKPKAEVVVDEFLVPIWNRKEDLAEISQKTQSLEETHKAMGGFRGWGGGGFMSYEVVTDLNYTTVLASAKDRYTWANAGPGAKRGLNRMTNQTVKKAMSQPIANKLMQMLLAEIKQLNEESPPTFAKVDPDALDMRTVEHSLCEFDKYMRVKKGEGTPRSKFSGKKYDEVREAVVGAVL